jgi:hypothetical protein
VARPEERNNGSSGHGIIPQTRSAQAYAAEDQWIDLNEAQSLSGGEVLPGFELSLKGLFAKADEERPV